MKSKLNHSFTALQLDSLPSVTVLFAADMWIVVNADVVEFATSEQFTTVPFKPMLTESIDNVETRGEAP